MGKVSTYETIEQKVRAVAEQEAFGKWNYIYDGWYTINERMSSERLPAILNILPSSGKLRIGNTQITDIGDCVIAFCDRCDFDFDGQDTDLSVVERLKRCADAFIVALNRSGYFKPISDEVIYSVMFDHLDVNVAVVAIQVTLEEQAGIPVCGTTTIDSILDYE